MSDWAKRKVVDLKAELKRRGLPQHGLKAELVARLEEAEQEAEAEAEEEEEQAETQGDDETAAQDEDEAVAEGKDEHMTDSAAPEAVVHDEGEPSSPQASTTQESMPPPLQTVSDEVSIEEKETENGDTTTTQDDAMNADIVTTGVAQSAEQDAVIDKDPMVAKEASPILSNETRDIEMVSDDKPLTTGLEPEGEDVSKRKRRSQSPPPNEENARKRVRADDGGASIAPDVIMEQEAEGLGAPTQVEDISREAAITQQVPENVADEDRPSVPSVHPATPALYISNLMRPLREDDMKMHLNDLATSPGISAYDDTITTFFLDPVRTHCFVVFASTTAASRARSQLHDVVWPNESNRKPLWVDFVPPEEVPGWIEKEESAGRAGPRYEVVYRDNPDGSVTAVLDTIMLGASGNRPPSGPSNPSSSGRRPLPAEGPNSIPIGPRALRDFQAPTGPRPKRSGPGPRPAPAVGGPVHRTRSGPFIEYRLVGEELARRRLASIRAHYASDAPRRNPGDDLNRYSFENGDGFVDRGKEVFEGIRPPHRERGRGGDRRGGGHGFRRGGRGWRGGRDARPRSDRYLPGASYGGRDNRRPPRGDRDYK
ncbi:hypothetical protein N3K66_008077 [Trichothecium roseum]|uniref:Uncharacterized protein n=1 Tax=Trichothecium roseum TaxID=47278 RepID=A0ACC0USK2_9HYPO|nr:hypothetical protein N3K66_008077 [Trichothecium roseum]